MAGKRRQSSQADIDRDVEMVDAETELYEIKPRVRAFQPRLPRRLIPRAFLWLTRVLSFSAHSRNLFERCTDANL